MRYCQPQLRTVPGRRVGAGSATLASDPGRSGLLPVGARARSIAEVAAGFRALAAIGYTDVVVRRLRDDHERVLASLARLGEVREAVQDA